jgi:beta-glucosidase
MERIRFPPGFLWGAASAAYQVEGSPLADDSGPTTWHEFSHRRGKVKDRTTGDAACDHYRRYREDVGLVGKLGLGAYRFSVGWGRIFPEKGRLNQKGLDFYQRLVDCLLEAGIQPWLTIMHLEEPLWLARAGGFTKRESVDHLLELGTVLFRALGDRVRNWITVNEPTIHSVCGYFLGEFPPGRRVDLRGMFHCLHHLLLGHARLCEAWTAMSGGAGERRTNGAEGAAAVGRIGLAHHSLWTAPADAGRERDIDAAAFMDEVANRTVLDVMFRGAYPRRAVSRLGAFFPRGFERDLSSMKQPGTCVGINYYTRICYRWSWYVPFSHAMEHIGPGFPRSAMWEIYPEGIAASLLRLRDDYGNPQSIITENGFPLADSPGADPLDDTPRIAYLSDHIAQVGMAIASGADCRGYFHWSLMDNFEWNKGLSMRFGLLRTDFDTQERTWKKSASWYREIAMKNWIDAPSSASSMNP